MAHFRRLDHAYYKMATVATTMSVVSARPHILDHWHREDIERRVMMTWGGEMVKSVRSFDRKTRLFSTLELS